MDGHSEHQHFLFPIQKCLYFQFNYPLIRIDTDKQHCIWEGCPWEGTHEDLVSHQAICVYRKVRCHYCRKVFVNKNLDLG